MGEKYKFKGHEKFHLREGWLNKGLQGVSDNPRVFMKDDGPDILGVGSNMVKSIRYWMQAFGLIEESAKEGAKLSEFAELIYRFDPYFEDNFTLWLLHSRIAHNSERATMWYLFFQNCEAEEFTKDELRNVMKKEVVAFVGSDSVPVGTINDDIDVLLNMYGKVNSIEDPEDKNKCPLASLGLLKKDKENYYRLQPDLRGLDERIILCEISDLLHGENSVSIATIADMAKKIYNLNRVTLNGYLDRLDNQGYIKVDRTAGLDVVYPITVPSREEIIRQYYE